MDVSFLIEKYKNQIQAMHPSYDKLHQLNKDDPIVFEDSENVRMAFAAISDPHLVSNDNATQNLYNVIYDLQNSKEHFDALVVAGDLTDYGKIDEYNRFFGVFDNYKMGADHFLVTMGNHDVRFRYKRNTKIIMDKVEQYLKIDTHKKSYYSYDLNGYTFIVLGTEKAVLEKAYISQTQIDFLDSELKRATANSKPAFVMCHQAFAETHGLPEVWETGDMGEQSAAVRAVMEKYNNVFFVNGHLHGGICDKDVHTLNKEKCVYSVSVPSYRKLNNFGHKDCGTGFYCCVYDDKVVFTARNFLTGNYVDAPYSKHTFELIK